MRAWLLSVPLRVRACRHAVACAAIASSLSAAELPVVAVTIHPDGAVVERAGTLAAGETIVHGLPAHLDPDQMIILADGMPVREARWILPATMPSADPAAAQRLRILDQLSTNAAAVARAQRHGALLDLVAATARKSDAAAAMMPLAHPAAIDAAIAAEAAQRRMQRASIHALREERERLLADLAGLSAPAAAEPAGALRLTFAASSSSAASFVAAPAESPRVVRISYHLGATWSLRWQCRIREAQTGTSSTELMPIAEIQVGLEDRWGAAPITLAVGEQQLQPLAVDAVLVRTYGLAEALGGLERPYWPGTYHCVDGPPERWFQRMPPANGKFGSPPYDDEINALYLLVFMGSGYDHASPNKFRSIIGKSLAALRHADPRQLSLTALALGTTALCEAFAMTADRELNPLAVAWTELLIRRAFDLRELPGVVASNAPFAGPMTATYVAMAMKSAQSAGVSFATDQLRALLRPEDFLSADVESSRIALACARALAGEAAPLIDDATAAEWKRRWPRWLATGRVELLWAATRVCHHQGGDLWQYWSSAVRDAVIKGQATSGPYDGMWSYPHPGGRVAATALSTLSMEIFYRYTMETRRRRGASGEATPSQTTPSDIARSPRVSSPWPVRFALPSGVRVDDGRAHRVALPGIALRGALARTSLPVQDGAVWRVLNAANPGPLALPAGPCDIEIDGEQIGAVELPFLAPGASCAIPAGLDPRLRVERRVSVSSDDGWFSRSASVRVDLTLTGPPGLTALVEVCEALPIVKDSDVAVTLREPALDKALLKHRLDHDPFHRARLSLAPGSLSTTTLRYDLSYPAGKRPYLEYLP